MTDQLKLLRQLRDTKKKIHDICAISNCSHYKKCVKTNSVCTSDNFSQYRKIIKINGGDFDLYLSIRKKLMELNYPLVISIAAKIGGISVDDLCQEGMLGLCESIDKFDLDRGTQFSTYAYYYIRKTILDFIRENKTVKTAAKISHLTKITEDAFDLLVQENPYKIQYITTKQLLVKIKQLRTIRKMKNLVITENEIDTHLNRLKFDMTLYETKMIENDIEQEHQDNFYNILIKKIDDDMEDNLIGITETIKFRFGLGKYNDISIIPKVASVIGFAPSTIENNIKNFFERIK